MHIIKLIRKLINETLFANFKIIWFYKQYNTCLLTKRKHLFPWVREAISWSSVESWAWRRVFSFVPIFHRRSLLPLCLLAFPSYALPRFPPKTVFHTHQFSSATKSCLTLCNPMNCSTPGLPVHHQLLESTQTYVHWVSDAIQPSRPLSSRSPPALNLSQHQGLFQWVNSSHQVAKVLEFQLQHQSFQWTPRTDLLYDGLVGSPCSPRDSQESSPTPHFKSINSLTLSFLHSPTLTSIHDY